MIFVVCLGLYLNTYKDNIQQFHRGNYVEANNNNNYFNLDLDNQSIEYYNGEAYTIFPDGSRIVMPSSHFHLGVMSLLRWNIVK